VDGTIKGRLIIACNCTEQQQNLLKVWTNGLTVNGRAVEVYVVRTNLDEINMPSDVLLIWGYRDITPFRDSLLGYIKKENGIVEMMNFPIDPEPVQQEIFGITNAQVGWGSSSADEIVDVTTAKNVTYQAYKIYLNGLKGQNPITPEFCKTPPNKKIAPVSDSSDIGILMRGDDRPGRDYCVIINDKKTAKVAWIADFTDIAYNANHTKLLTSVLLSVSNKKAFGVLSPNLKIGYVTSYINVKNADMFEVYKFNLGLGHPY
jgi:hypothetical protein